MKKNTISVADTPKLIQEWDYPSNEKVGIISEKTSNGSQKKAYWICRVHQVSFQQIIRARLRGEDGCPLCKASKSREKGRERYLKGKDVLSVTNPELVNEWISAEDARITPDTCTAGSNAYVCWECNKCKGRYRETVSNRALKHTGCPYCSGQKVLIGYNDLQFVNPYLAAEWGEKNKFGPETITNKSNRSVYWKCIVGHDEYISSPKKRNNGQGCPECAKYSHTSFPEQALFFYMKECFEDAESRCLFDNYEIDIYIPSRNIGVEYNGRYYHWHKSDNDRRKKEYLEKNGVKVITIKEYENLGECDGAEYYIKSAPSFMDLSILIKSLLNELVGDNRINVNCEKDMMAIREQYINSLRKNSIVQKSPEIAEEWDSNKNGKIRPEYVSYGSNQQYYWICKKCGFSYLCSPKNRIRGHLCNCCSGKIVVPGINDLATKYKELADEWDCENNEGLTPNNVSFGSGKEVSWICKQGHRWKATINQRTSSGTGCPYCSGRMAISGINDLETLRSDLLSEWDYEKNTISPRELSPGSNRRVWWKCECGHSYLWRVNNKSSVPGCAICRKEQKRINVYDSESHSFLFQCNSIRELCNKLGLDYAKQHGNISMVCSRKQKTIMNKYILRHPNDDEFGVD